MIQGKTVVMVTHRKPLLDLMDVIYVLENGQLTDVKNLGGLEAYLARLEGFEQKVAEQQIAQEQQAAERDPEWEAAFTTSYQEEMSVLADEQPPQQNSEQLASSQPQSEIHPNTQNKDSDEVEIKLH